ncbi:MAG: hypothetical protein JO242_06325, partial [Streptosporangiaceae bacterium]|nr:hypothetical protein [Streptosporangiaceae bacterium]
MHFGLGRAVTEMVSAAAVLAAFGAGFRYLAGRAFGRQPGVPRLRAARFGRRGGLMAWLVRAGWRAVVLA